jgi:hypothetical protein
MNRRQRTEDRCQRTEDRCQRAEVFEWGIRNEERRSWEGRKLRSSNQKRLEAGRIED